MRMNCVSLERSRSRSRKRPTLDSSNIASTSSNTQNGVGETRKSANTSATAVKLRSPPESKTSPCSRFPGNLASISIPLSIGDSSSESSNLAEPPLKRRENISVNSVLTALKVFRNSSRMTASSSVINFSMSWIASFRSEDWLLRLSNRSLTSTNSVSASRFTVPMRRI